MRSLSLSISFSHFVHVRLHATSIFMRIWCALRFLFYHFIYVNLLKSLTFDEKHVRWGMFCYGKTFIPLRKPHDFVYSRFFHECGTNRLEYSKKESNKKKTQSIEKFNLTKVDCFANRNIIKIATLHHLQ